MEFVPARYKRGSLQQVLQALLRECFVGVHGPYCHMHVGCWTAQAWLSLLLLAQVGGLERKGR
jgi:hypothetical protein